jgi:hypothetical protein
LERQQASLALEEDVRSSDWLLEQILAPNGLQKELVRRAVPAIQQFDHTLEVPSCMRWFWRNDINQATYSRSNLARTRQIWPDFAAIITFPPQHLMFVSLNDIRNSRVQGHGIRIVSYALVGLVTVDSIEVNYVAYIY